MSSERCVNRPGRPSDFSPELAKKICDTIASSDCGIKKICDAHDWMPSMETVFRWRYENKQFYEQYLQAKQFQAEVYAESTIDIAAEKPTYLDERGNERVDSGHVAWQKLNINTRQWHASKLAPKIYGDKSAAEVVNNTLEDSAERLERAKKAEKEF